MAHFAEIDENNTVISVMAVHNNELLVDDIESEQAGIAFCNTIKQARWVQTSYNHNIRKQYAGVGFTYDADADVFIAPKPYPSWTLDTDHDWQPPTPMPDGDWVWNESDQSWVEPIVG